MSVLIHTWLKKIIPCRYCGSTEVRFYLKQGTKIERYGVICNSCRRGIGWLPDSLMPFIIKEGFKIIHEREK